MNTNFNIVKKPKKEDVEIEEDEEEIELDDGDDKPSKSSSNDLRKRMFLVMGFIVGGTILLLFILYLCSLLMHKTYDYADIENLMESSAKKYFKDNPNYLPTEEGNIVELDVNNLVAIDCYNQVEANFNIILNMCINVIRAVEESKYEKECD